MVVVFWWESDKKCGEYKNWVKMLRSDSYKGAILARKNGKNEEYKNEKLD